MMILGFDVSARRRTLGDGPCFPGSERSCPLLSPRGLLRHPLGVLLPRSCLHPLDPAAGSGRMCSNRSAQPPHSHHNHNHPRITLYYERVTMEWGERMVATIKDDQGRKG